MKKLIGVIKDYFQNLIYYNNKRRLVALSVLLFLIGSIVGGYIYNRITMKILNEIFIAVIINAIIIYMYIIEKNDDILEKNYLFKIILWSVNICIYGIILFTNYNYIINTFSKIKNNYLPNNLYAVIVSTIIFLVIISIEYTLMFAKITKAKVTSKGFEVEIDETNLNNKQNQILNIMDEMIVSVTDINADMDNIVSDFLLGKVLDESNNIKDTYGINELFDCLRNIATKLFNPSIIVDFISIEQLSNIKENFNIPDNIYNRIIARIHSLTDKTNSVFAENNILFVTYKIQSMIYDELENNRIVAIIEFKDKSKTYNGYGRLILDVLKMFDCIFTLQINVVINS